MIMLESSEGNEGGGTGGRNILMGAQLGSPPPSCATEYNVQWRLESCKS